MESKGRATLKSKLKNIVKRTLSSPPAYHALLARARRGKKITILCYHTLGSDNDDFDAWTVLRVSDFRQQVAFLKAHYDIVALDRALDHKQSCERPLAVLTFDDGEAGLHTHLLPIIEEEKIPVTIYAATSHIVCGEPYWFDRIMNALQCKGALHLDLRPIGLREWRCGPEIGVSRWTIISDILENLKTIPPDQRAVVTSEILKQTSSAQMRSFTPLAPLQEWQLAELSRSGCVTVGSHSHCHNLLDQLTPGDVRESAERSRALLRGWTGQRIDHFAYPNGNHHSGIERIIAALGYKSAAALGMSLWDGASDHFRLPRILVGRYDNFDRFKLRLAGV